MKKNPKVLALAASDTRPHPQTVGQPKCTCRRRENGESTPPMPTANDWYYRAPLNSLHSEKVIAARVGVSSRTLEASRRTGVGHAIPFVLIGRKVRYLKADVEDWLRQHPVKASTSDCGTPLGHRHPLEQWMSMGVMAEVKR